MKKTRMIIMLAFMLGAFQVQAQQQQVLPPLVSVSGVGEVRVKPTEVVVNLGVETREKTLDAARTEADKKAAAIISYLKKQGIDEKNIQTSYVTLRPVYSGGEYGKTSPDFYMAIKTMTVVIKKLNKYDEIVSGLYEVGANRIDGVNFQVGDMEKYYAEARKKAVANAKQKATSLTSELGAKLGRVYSISDNQSGGGPRPMYKMAMMESVGYGDQSGPSISAGEMVITSTVDVSFIIE